MTICKIRPLKYLDNKSFILVDEFTKDKLPDYQMSAWLATVFINKLSEEETSWLTQALCESGEKLTWKAKQQIVVTAGNAGAVDVVYNGKSLGKLGATGDVVTKKITQDKAENAD